MIRICLIEKKWRCGRTALLQLTDIRFLWRRQTACGICRVSWVFSISFIQTQTLPLPCVSLDKSHPLIHSKSWISKEPSHCPVWRSLFNLSWPAPGRMPFEWLFLSFFPHFPQELTKTNAVCFFFPGNVFHAWTHEIREEGRKTNTQGCCVQLYRLCTLQGVQQRRRVRLKSRPHSTCPKVGPGPGPVLLEDGHHFLIHTEALSWLTLVPPTLFLSSFLSLSSLLFSL